MIETGKKEKTVSRGCGKCCYALLTVSLIVGVLAGVGFFYREELKTELAKLSKSVTIVDDLFPSNMKTFEKK
jgi:hypothetical protein